MLKVNKPICYSVQLGLFTSAVESKYFNLFVERGGDGMGNSTFNLILFVPKPSMLNFKP